MSNKNDPIDATNSEMSVAYVTRHSVWWRAFATTLAIGFCWLLVTRDTSGHLAIVVAWARFGWVVRLGILFSFIVVPALLLESFLSKTVFGVDVIQRRDVLGRQYSFQYEDALSMEVIPEEFVGIHFSQGRKLTIRRSTADLNRVQAIMNARSPTILTHPAPPDEGTE